MDAYPDIENQDKPENPQPKDEPKEKEPEIIDAEFTEVEAAEPENENARVDIADPEHYTRSDVTILKETYSQELKIYKQEQMPENTIRKLRILLDAVTMLDGKLKAEEEADQ